MTDPRQLVRCTIPGSLRHVFLALWRALALPLLLLLLCLCGSLARLLALSSLFPTPLILSSLSPLLLCSDSLGPSCWSLLWNSVRPKLWLIFHRSPGIKKQLSRMSVSCKKKKTHAIKVANVLTKSSYPVPPSPWVRWAKTDHECSNVHPNAMRGAGGVLARSCTGWSVALRASDSDARDHDEVLPKTLGVSWRAYMNAANATTAGQVGGVSTGSLVLFFCLGIRTWKMPVEM